MADASQENGEDDAISVLETAPESNKLSDNDKLKLISLMKTRRCMWGEEKYRKQLKTAALAELEAAFDLMYTGADLLSAFKSLRSSMMREVKKQRKDPGYSPTWKFYQSLLFLKPTLDKACDKSEEWQDEEKRTRINFYQRNPELWNHKSKDYHDTAKRQVLLGKLKEELQQKYDDKEMVLAWNKLKGYFDRERLREKGSQASGSGTSQVYHSSWKFFKEMEFVADANIEPDVTRSTLDLNASSPSPSTSSDDTPPTSLIKRKRKSTAMSTDEEFSKRNQMYDAAIEFMKQPAPPQPLKQKTDDDLFGEYVASQLKLVNDPRSKLGIKARINNLLLMQQMEQITPVVAPSVNNI